MNPSNLLSRFSNSELSLDDEAQLTQELADAYHMDEAAATSRHVQRIAEKVRARMLTVGPCVSTPCKGED